MRPQLLLTSKGSHLMKSFRLAFCLACLGLLVLSGCTKYQYAYVSSHLQQTATKEFINENDSVRIRYTFAGENCPITIEVFNKLSVPVYVDWKKSAVVINNQRFSYWTDEASLQGSMNNVGIQWTRTVSSNHGRVNGSIKRDEQISFIPPQAYVTVSPLVLKQSFFALPGQSETKEIMPAIGTSAKRIRYLYNQQNAPFSFRSFVTLATSEDFASPTFIDDVFWVSEVTETIDAPPYIIDNSANLFYVRKPSGF